MELIMKQQKSWTETAIRFAVDIPVNKSYLETNLYSLGMNVTPADLLQHISYSQNLAKPLLTYFITSRANIQLYIEL